MHAGLTSAQALSFTFDSPSVVSITTHNWTLGVNSTWDPEDVSPVPLPANKTYEDARFNLNYTRSDPLSTYNVSGNFTLTNADSGVLQWTYPLAVWVGGVLGNASCANNATSIEADATLACSYEVESIPKAEAEASPALNVTATLTNGTTVVSPGGSPNATVPFEVPNQVYKSGECARVSAFFTPPGALTPLNNAYMAPIGIIGEKPPVNETDPLVRVWPVGKAWPRSRGWKGECV